MELSKKDSLSLSAFLNHVKPINDVDPIKYYHHPIVGYLFRRRIEMGLELLDSNYNRVLEIGYGSGFLLPYLATKATEVFGVDLEANPEEIVTHLRKICDHPFVLRQGDALQMPFDDGSFDCITAFSIYEHISDVSRGLSELHRVTRPGAHILIGMPAVNKFMELSFRTIGFKNIEDHHVTKPSEFLKAAHKIFDLEKKRTLPFNLPVSAGLYNTFLFRRRS